MKLLFACAVCIRVQSCDREYYQMEISCENYKGASPYIVFFKFKEGASIPHNVNGALIIPALKCPAAMISHNWSPPLSSHLLTPWIHRTNFQVCAHTISISRGHQRSYSSKIKVSLTEVYWQRGRKKS